MAIYRDQIKEAAVCDITQEKGTYCQPYLGVGGLTLSKEVKTVGAGKVSSWASYVDKGKSVAKSFEGDITDRIAPIILSARSEADNEDGTIDKVTIILSEPAKVLASDVAQEAFSYYLNSATTAEEGAARYRNSNSPGKPQDKQDTISLRYNNTSKNNPTPHVGDYVRFRADALVWSDTAEINSMGKDTIRVGAGPNWNSPTDYCSTDRLPSPWVKIEKDIRIIKDDKSSEVFATPSFRVKMVGPFQFVIVLDDDVGVAKSYAVTDLQGTILAKGMVQSKETYIPRLSSGTYIVRVGLGSRLVKVK